MKEPLASRVRVRGWVRMPARRLTGRGLAAVIAQYSWGVHRQGGVLGRAVGIVGCGGVSFRAVTVRVTLAGSEVRLPSLAR